VSDILGTVCDSRSHTVSATLRDAVGCKLCSGDPADAHIVLKVYNGVEVCTYTRNTALRTVTWRDMCFVPSG
jgi:hypothetical protein